jgi:hypothetical protein
MDGSRVIHHHHGMQLEDALRVMGDGEIVSKKNTKHAL